MDYIKSNPEISFEDFFRQSKLLLKFKSLRGHEYEIKKWNETQMIFERLTTNKIWKMDLKDVHRAFLELNTFKTSDFKPYLNRTYSPALGLLITLKLLSKE